MADRTHGQIYFEDVEEGAAIPTLEKTPSNTLLFLYSAVTWNPQRIHFDRDFTLQEGYREVIVHGPLRGAFLSQLMTEWIGEGFGSRRGHHASGASDEQRVIEEYAKPRQRMAHGGLAQRHS